MLYFRDITCLTSHRIVHLRSGVPRSTRATGQATLTTPLRRHTERHLPPPVEGKPMSLRELYQVTFRGVQQGCTCSGGVRALQLDGSQRGDSSGGRAPPLRAHPTLPTGSGTGQGHDLCLLNHSNHCYANSVVIMLLRMHCTVHARTTAELDCFLSRLHRRSKKLLWSDIAWSNLTRGWARPSSQHDVAEFLTFLSGKGHFQTPACLGGWHSRRHMQGVQLRDRGITWPLPLRQVLTPNQTLADAIQAWHAQEGMHALPAEPHGECRGPAGITKQ